MIILLDITYRLYILQPVSSRPKPWRMPTIYYVHSRIHTLIRVYWMNRRPASKIFDKYNELITSLILLDAGVDDDHADSYKNGLKHRSYNIRPKIINGFGYL